MELILSSLWVLSLLTAMIVLIVIGIIHRKSPRGDATRELIYILPFAIFGIGSQLIHLLCVQSRPVGAVLEMTAFTILWVFVYKRNMEKQEWCKSLILGAAVLQFVVMWVLRQYVY